MIGEQITSPVTRIGDWLVQITAESIPLVITSSLIIVLGWLVATLIGRIIQKTLKSVNLDEWLERRNIKKALFDVSMESFMASIFKWYIFILFLQEAAEQIKFYAISNFFASLLLLFPQWFVGGLTIAVALVIGNWLKMKVKESEAAFTDVLGNLVYGFIAYIGVVLALPKFGFTNVEILIDAFRLFVGGLSAGMALAIGIGFGWAIKEGPAKNFFKRFEKDEEED